MIIHELNTCTSTNDLALESIDGQHGETWISLEQTKGRGRRHGGERRSWFSPADSGVYFSILLRPNCKPSKISAMTLVVGAAVCDVLSQYQIEPWLKWPNDVFVGTQKIAGILTEASTIDGILDRVVIGVGININLKLEDVPIELKTSLTSLSIETGTTTDRIDVAKKVRANILEKADLFLDQGFGHLFDYVRDFDRSRGISVETSRGRGTALGITTSGNLEVENKDGRFEVNAGEVVFLFETQK